MDTSPTSPNALADLAGCGTSVWLDFVSRDLLRSGKLARLIEQDDVRGLTSNPAIFERAIGHSTDYDAALAALVREADRPVGALFEALAIEDIKEAADTLAGVYRDSGGVDGYASLEVAPTLAHDTDATVGEARRLWRAVDRPNLMVKVPGTPQGAKAVATLIGEGININVTLLFAVDAYRAVADAYISGLEQLVARGGDPSRVASVASFFVSRIDGAIEAETARIGGTDPARAAKLGGLRGRIAIANAKRAYRLYQQMIESPRWQALQARGARPQRLLWASTGTKLSGLSDTLYVDGLIGPDTVNTMPPATMDAVRDHGSARVTLTEGLAEAEAALATLAACGVALEAITDALVVDGVQQFIDAADKLYAVVARKRLAILDGPEPRQILELAPALDAAVKAEAEVWRAAGTVRRLWARDASVWTGTDEAAWLGWLDLPEMAADALPGLRALAAEIRERGMRHVVLLGMGGSSLGPEVLSEVLGSATGFPTLHLVDSTDPAQIRAVREAITIAQTLFIVSSKSGSTLEPSLFRDYFLAEAKEAGLDVARHFIAVTDPGSALEKEARRDGFGHVFAGLASVGGRFSVLSAFGLVPGAAIGADPAALVASARAMARSCGADVPASENPGVMLGLALGLAARAGRDKATLIASPALSDLGAWLEQLFAESTGKQGRGIIPVDREPARPAAEYGTDRFFVYLALRGEEDPDQRARVAALAEAGAPVARIVLADRAELSGEFFRFEMAIAVAGSVLGIDPFNQPDVEASKIETRRLMDEYSRTGSLPASKPLFEDERIAVHAEGQSAATLAGAHTLAEALATHFGQAGPGDYLGLLAFVRRDRATEAAIQALRARLAQKFTAATVAGFGPRFLHSTGQAYKGGPNSGIFLQITGGDGADLAVPGRGYGFATVKAAQAAGDFAVLNARGRRAMRVHLKADASAGLAALATALDTALS